MLKSTTIIRAACLFGLFGVFSLFTACDFNKKELAQKVVAVLAEKGQQHASAYIDQLAAEEKITPEKAEKIKAAIPLGIEAVKKAIEKSAESPAEEASDKSVSSVPSTESTPSTEGDAR